MSDYKIEYSGIIEQPYTFSEDREINIRFESVETANLLLFYHNNSEKSDECEICHEAAPLMLKVIDKNCFCRGCVEKAFRQMEKS